MRYKDVSQLIKSEYEWYLFYLYHNTSWVFALHGLLSHASNIQIAKWQKASRKLDYWRCKRRHFKLGWLAYLYYERKTNCLAAEVNIEASTQNIGRNLRILHRNIVINGNAKIGENLRLLGSNVIGNGGPNKLGCPIIGDNVTMGAGAKVLGPVCIADGITIAAGAVVVSSFNEKGITIGGVPAKKIK